MDVTPKYCKIRKAKTTINKKGAINRDFLINKNVDNPTYKSKFQNNPAQSQKQRKLPLVAVNRTHLSLL